MFAINPGTSTPQYYQGSYPSYPVFSQHTGFNWNHGPSFGGDHQFSHIHSPGIHPQYSSIQPSSLGSLSNPSNHSWSYIPPTPVRSIQPTPSVYSSFNIAPVTPGPLYSSHSSIGGASEAIKSDLYSSSSSLNNVGLHLTSAEPQSLTTSASFSKQEPAKKAPSRIHDTPAAAGLRNAVLNSDQAQEYFRMKQNGTLPHRGPKKSTGEPNVLQTKQNVGTEISRSPPKNPLTNSGLPSPWGKSPPGTLLRLF